MRVEITPITSWKRVLDAARFTVGKESTDKEPSGKFIRNILLSEHSPIRLREYDIRIYDVPYCNVMHLVRHFMGVEKFVSTQRDDRTDSRTPRKDKPQGAMVNVMFSVNAQALINISKVRLCKKADPDTLRIWLAVRDEMRRVDQTMAWHMKPKCVRLGYCTEIESCGWIKHSPGQLEYFNWVDYVKSLHNE